LPAKRSRSAITTHDIGGSRLNQPRTTRRRLSGERRDQRRGTGTMHHEPERPDERFDQDRVDPCVEAEQQPGLSSLRREYRASVRPARDQVGEAALTGNESAAASATHNVLDSNALRIPKPRATPATPPASAPSDRHNVDIDRPAFRVRDCATSREGETAAGFYPPLTF
jgi:hypothetical protein